jgi:hypothetical protein
VCISYTRNTSTPVPRNKKFVSHRSSTPLSAQPAHIYLLIPATSLTFSHLAPLILFHIYISTTQISFMSPPTTRGGRMLQRSSAPMPLNLAPAATASTKDTSSEPKVGVQGIDDLPPRQQSFKPQQQPQQQTPPKVHRPIFSASFSFDGAAPSPPPSAGLPNHSRPRAARSKSPSSARNSILVDDEESEWDTTKLLPQFQHTIRRPSLLTPPTTSDSRRASYDKTTHLGYDDGSTELLPPGRRSSVPTHHLRPEQSPDRHHHAGFRRSSLATTSITRQDMEDENKHHVETVSKLTLLRKTWLPITWT